jgi:GrpB-like predicted nucleotidyltransferase (UPF0157 family)
MSVPLTSHDPKWAQHFELESKQLLEALGGWAWEGGVVYLLEHIGSTSILHIIAKPCIDIVIGIYPFPLAESFIQKLQKLGYEYSGENGIAERQYFRRGPHDVHLHVYSIENDAVINHVLFRDYLRANHDARERYENLKRDLSQQTTTRAAYTDGKSELIKTLLKEAHEWHIETVDFKPVDFIKWELSDLKVSWAMSSGWGIDLLLGQVTRYHQDLDICIWRSDQQTILGYLKSKGWDIHVPVDGVYRPWQEGEWLELPLHQVHARKSGMPFELLDILMMEHDNAHWIYRRKPKVTMPKQEVMIFKDDIYVVNPAIILLFKSRTSAKFRGKDQHDFEAVLPHLTAAQKVWLDRAFEVWMPEHSWRSLLK